MARRTRRRRYTWFPILGTTDPNPEGNDDTDGRTFAVPFDGSGATNAIAFPLIPDVQTEPDTAVANTNQIQLSLSSDYVIERIVGKCFVAVGAPADDVDAIAPKILLCGVGLFVANQADAQAGGGPNIPVGAAGIAELLENYNPLSNDTARQPWMWKRDWILHTGRPDTSALAADENTFGTIVTVVPNVGPVVAAGAPTTNINCGSVMDGPHIDVKVSRRVRSNQRLWCIAAVRSLDRILENANPTSNILGTMKGLINVRVLGALRKPTRQSSFA